MAQPVLKIDEEIKITDPQEEEEDDQSTNDSSTDVAGINLVLILSLLSLSAEERGNMDETEERESDRLKKQSCSVPSSRSDFVKRKREVNEFRAAERQTTKVHSRKIRDCRHCRRL